LFIAFLGKAQADWPEFRGPAQNGVVAAGTKLPVEWLVQDEQRKNVRWHTPTEGLGWSSPVVVGNAIYVTSARQGSADQGSTRSDPKTLAETLTGPQSLYLSCYNASNGLLIFDQKIFDQPTDAWQDPLDRSGALLQPCPRQWRLADRCW